MDGDDPDFAVPGMGFVLLNPGTFTMGCVTGRDDVEGGCFGQETPAHAVTLTGYLWMAETETTQEQWEGLMGNNPSSFSGWGADHPVEYVNWYEALAFTNAMSAAEGVPECYALSGCTSTPGNDMECSTVTATAASGSVYDCEGYRLPTEAEWEYAARGDEDWPFSGSDVVGDVAWYWDNTGSTTHPVGELGANAWDLFDMSGNVWEWTWDWYFPSYYSSYPVTDPVGPTSGSDRVERGGSWGGLAAYVRVAYRHGRAPGERNPTLGFRVVRSP